MMARDMVARDNLANSGTKTKMIPMVSRGNSADCVIKKHINGGQCKLHLDGKLMMCILYLIIQSI